MFSLRGRWTCRRPSHAPQARSSSCNHLQAQAARGCAGQSQERIPFGTSPAAPIQGMTHLTRPTSQAIASSNSSHTSRQKIPHPTRVRTLSGLRQRHFLGRRPRMLMRHVPVLACSLGGGGARHEVIYNRNPKPKPEPRCKPGS